MAVGAATARGMSGIVEIVGRRAEVERLQAFVADTAAGSGGTLVVEGAPGTGRTAIVDAALRDVPRGTAVARGAGGADDQLLAYAVLTDLCRPFLDVVDELPTVQAAALRGALALGPPTGDRLAVAAGFLSLVHLRAGVGPLVLVVDDAHLLDDGTATAVAFAARRLAGFAAGMVIVQDPDSPTRLSLPSAERLPVGALGFDDARRLAREVAPGADPAVIAEVIAATDGRPGRLVQVLRGSSPSDDPVVVLDDETTARRAAARGSHADEAGAHERAGRWIPAASAWLAAGEGERALSCVELAEREPREPAEAAAVQLVRGRAEMILGRGRRARATLEAAAVDAEEACDVVLAARCTLLALPLLVHTGGFESAGAALARARQLLADVPPDAGPHRLLSAAEAAVALAGGREVDIEPLLELVDTDGDDPDRLGAPFFVTTVALPLIWAERYGPARHLLERTVAVARRRGAVGGLPLPLAALAVLERRQGNQDRALVAATEARHVAAATGQRGAELFAVAELAQIYAQRGDLDRCREAAETVLTDAGRADSTVVASARSALATIELWLGHWDAVIALLEPVVDSAAGRLAPVVTMYHQNLLAAYVFAGRRDDARRLLPALEAQAATSGRVRAVLERCRGLLAANGEYEAHFERAMAAAPTGFGRALSALFFGTRLATDGRHAEAIAVMSELATSQDDQLVGIRRAAGAVVARLGLDLGVAAAGPPSGAHLDPTELSVVVARLDGAPLLSIADRFLLSPPEVEQLRARAYGTLGVTTTAELRDLLGPPTDKRQGTLIRLLGGLVVETPEGARTPPAGAPAIAVAAIALRRSMHVEELGELLWPEATPAIARRRLRNVLSRIRRTVGDVIERRGDSLAVAAGTTVDVHELEAAALRASAGQDDAAEDIGRALRLYRGPLLPELLYEEWTAADRRRLYAVQCGLRRALADRSAAAGDIDEALAVLEHSVGHEPDDIDLVRHAMRLARSHGRCTHAASIARRAVDAGLLPADEADLVIDLTGAAAVTR